jgi:hypothetical protein
MNKGSKKIQHGVELKNGKFANAELSFKGIDRSKVYGYGTPITISAAKKMIKNYWEFLKKLHKDPKQREATGHDNISLTIGKEALFSILAQEKCEGIRFYFAKKSNEEVASGHKIENWDDGITLIAVGVDEKERDIIENMDTEFLISNIEEKNHGTRLAKSGSLCELRESLPPKKLTTSLKEKSEIGKIVQKFFRK